MKSSSLLFLAAGLLMAIAGARPAAAQLIWERKSAAVQVKSAEVEVRAAYRFHNAGSYPVEIKSLHPDCTCTTAQLEKRVYAPGEDGQVEIIFTVGQRVGENVNAVQVLTDDPAAASTILILEVTVRESVQIAPRFLYWRQGEALAAKSARVELAEDEPLRFKEVRCSNPFFQTQMLPKAGNNRFQLIVTPENTNSREIGTVMVVVITPAGTEQTFQATVRVL